MVRIFRYRYISFSPLHSLRISYLNHLNETKLTHSRISDLIELGMIDISFVIHLRVICVYKRLSNR